MSILKIGRPSNSKQKALNAVQEHNNEMSKLTINISKNLHKKLKKYALDNDLTITDLVLKATADYMDKMFM